MHVLYQSVISAIAESLPNITDETVSVASMYKGVTRAGYGAFSNSGNTNTSLKTRADGGSSYFDMKFNASSSSSIYQDNAKVHPESYACMFYIKF